MMFDKLRQKIHNLRPSVKEEKIKLKAKREILATISNELGLDADGDTFIAVNTSTQHVMFYVDELSGILKVCRTYNEDDKFRKIENYESM